MKTGGGSRGKGARKKKIPGYRIYEIFRSRIEAGLVEEAFACLRGVAYDVDRVARILYVDQKAARRIKRETTDGVEAALQAWFLSREVPGKDREARKARSDARRLRHPRPLPRPVSRLAPDRALVKCPECRSLASVTRHAHFYAASVLECPVCLEPFEAVLALLQCGHAVCGRCCDRLQAMG